MTRSVERASYKVTFAVLVIGSMAYALLQSLVVPVLPTIQHEFHTSQNTVTWVLTAYLLSASIFTPILGRIGDMVGKERLLVGDPGRPGRRVGPGRPGPLDHRPDRGPGDPGRRRGVLPLSFGIIRDEFPTRRWPAPSASSPPSLAVGGRLGIVLAGPIVEHLGYHWLFWIPLIVTGIAAWSMAHFFVPESPVRTPGAVSWPAALLLSGWLVALLVGVSEAPVWGWGSARVLGLLGAGRRPRRGLGHGRAAGPAPR